jgi:hypothetical protein
MSFYDIGERYAAQTILEGARDWPEPRDEDYVWLDDLPVLIEDLYAVEPASPEVEETFPPDWVQDPWQHPEEGM